MFSFSNSNRSESLPIAGRSRVTGRRLRWVAVVVPMLSIVTGCGGVASYEQPDWAAATAADLEAAGTDPDVIGCVLDLASQDLKAGPLGPLQSEEAVRHCRTARSSVANGATMDVPDTELALTDVPWSFGDSAELDQLWIRCEQGEGSACDELFDRSAVGSDYEEFGVSCGARPNVVDCRELDQPE